MTASKVFPRSDAKRSDDRAVRRHIRNECSKGKCTKALALRLMPSCLCAVDTAEGLGNGPGQHGACPACDLCAKLLLRATGLDSRSAGVVLVKNLIFLNEPPRRCRLENEPR
jgi:hypothetical protein